MNDLTIAEPVNVDAIRSRILTIRGVQVMLDRDLAELYGVTTGALNQAVNGGKSSIRPATMLHAVDVAHDVLAKI